MGTLYRWTRVRSLVFAIITMVCLVYIIDTVWLHPRTETAMLERYMNLENIAPPPVSSKSSFDWSAVDLKYPPQTPLTPVPAGLGKGSSLPRVQHRFPSESISAARVREARRREVRQLFLKNWASYKEFAWMKDALNPISATAKDQFSGWAATLVDSLDTLWIMGLKAEFEEAVAAVATIDFSSSSSDRVNTFETNIRYLGGLMAAYDLSRRPVLLDKAVELGNMLYGAFNTEHRMPVDFINFNDAKTGKGLIVEGSVVSASPGTLSLEMTRLSQLTGDPKYYDAVAKVMDLFHDGQQKTKLPGMWPMFVSMSNRDVVSGSTFTIAGCADSLYEYLPKMIALLGGREPKYQAMTENFLKAANESLFFRPMLPGEENVLISGNVNVGNDGDKILDPESEHLACFIGGIYALAGRLLGREEWVEVGGRLTLGCYYAYQAMPTGMMPERFNMIACEQRGDCKWDEGKWDAGKKLRPEYKEHLPKGFTTAKDPRYILRPEAIESVFVLYRITGQRGFQEAAWEMWKAVSNGTLVDLGNAAVLDVTRKQDPLPKEDYMESFWLAETLKYFYLVFSPPDLISLDDYVLNTEAHPFRRHR
ncbi:glycoside hydrolase family 47 protein [Colletotrichum tofieldiae]|uniref:alpha-1,2-Mannosidase n=1 Tax=Colletotrichum tofieldiae TaxID=708197 RepID=A0A166YNY8_9PEZI|nr:glycoside hydrolase family 47 protein [Colletotrichum tofieldiae]GKT59601.1 glycoside hydrolase family 47 protein [Colletotrichum tofieldiae]GKT78399.1 glycoside hydrolase family 47 protein [Colletotrichum tofieldiae]GKT85761.1 glycoside hydrolase family 47 protein [Colletotrichum tofieldiae]